MNTSKAVVVAALVYGATTSIRPILMGVSIQSVLVDFFAPAFAFFCALCVLLSAAHMTGIMFCVLLVLLAPFLSVVRPIFVNLEHFTWAEYLASHDFNVALGIALFAFFGAIVGGPIVVEISRRQSKSRHNKSLE